MPCQKLSSSAQSRLLPLALISEVLLSIPTDYCYHIFRIQAGAKDKKKTVKSDQTRESHSTGYQNSKNYKTTKLVTRTTYPPLPPSHVSSPISSLPRPTTQAFPFPFPILPTLFLLLPPFHPVLSTALSLLALFLAFFSLRLAALSLVIGWFGVSGNGANLTLLLAS